MLKMNIFPSGYLPRVSWSSVLDLLTKSRETNVGPITDSTALLRNLLLNKNTNSNTYGNQVSMVLRRFSLHSLNRPINEYVLTARLLPNKMC